MLRICYIVFAALAFLLIPACVSIEAKKVVDEVVAPDMPVPDMQVTAFCEDTPGNRAEIRSILKVMDHPAYRRLMVSPSSTCLDLTMFGKASFAVFYTGDIGLPFKTPGEFCIQLMGFVDSGGKNGFSWGPVGKIKCGYKV